MAYQLSMDKSLSIKTLRDTGPSERAIAESLEVSRNTVRRHLASNPPNDTKAPTGLGESPESVVSSVSRSRCERFRDVIVSKKRKEKKGVRKERGKVSFFGLTLVKVALVDLAMLPLSASDLRHGQLLHERRQMPPCSGHKTKSE